METINRDDIVIIHAFSHYEAHYKGKLILTGDNLHECEDDIKSSSDEEIIEILNNRK